MINHSITAQSIASALHGKKAASGWIAKCPAHDDNSPSLSLSEHDGRILFKCHAGCSQESVLLVLQGQGLWPQKKVTSEELYKTVEEYIYFDADLQQALKVQRLESPSGKKKFFQSHWEAGQWIKGKGTKSIAPYKYEIWKSETSRRLFIVEGEKCAHAMMENGFLATTTPGGSSAWNKSYAEFFRGWDLIVIPDNDEPGSKYAARIFNDVQGIAKTVTIIQIPDLKDKEDVYDWFKLGHSAKDLQELVKQPSPLTQKMQLLIAAGQEEVSISSPEIQSWPRPLPLPKAVDELPEISLQDIEMLLPKILFAKVKDISVRIDVAPESVATMLFSVLGGLLGRRVNVRPKRNDNWLSYPCCLWGCLVSRPGNKKSPLLTEILKPIYKLEDFASEKFNEAYKSAQPKLQIIAEKKKFIEKQIKKSIEEPGEGDLLKFEADLASLSDEEAKAKPIRTRYYTSDATGPKLIEMMAENPSGLLIIRDELSGTFQNFDVPGNESLRTLFLESHAGTGRITQDRVSAGTRTANGMGATLIGSIQPGPLARILNASTDGMIQRFGLLVTLKDSIGELRDIAPDENANSHYELFCNAISHLSANAPVSLAFTPEAQGKFFAWYNSNTAFINKAGTSDAIRSHLSKYPSVLCALAAIIHLAELFERIGSVVGSTEISESTVDRAAEFIESILSPHATFIYERNSARASSEVLADRIMAGHVSNGMSLAKISHNEWSGLNSPQIVRAAADELADRNWIKIEERRNGTVGRVSSVILINPEILSEVSNAK